ncbi:MAG TPA: Cof-type HAD-IIB family hydrolase [Streptosporangiaceae bacterium]|nr:Cof-type HAD-IIB family hydrolase [Streptosporangiaceae bacterium]
MSQSIPQPSPRRDPRRDPRGVDRAAPEPSRRAAPRLVATDLDGTIVRSDGTVSARTIAALSRVERAGATLVLVTGRPPRWVGGIADDVAHQGLAICANGALVYDLHTESVIEQHLIPVAALRETVDRLRAALPELGFAVEYRDGIVYEPCYDRVGWDRMATVGELADGDAWLDRPCAKLLARHPTANADELLRHAVRAVGDIVTPTHSNGTRLLEMSARGVSKATTLARLCAERDIAAADVVAFGDMPNDLPMLAWAGRAYAVANAHPDVLAAVMLHAPSNDDDGVAHVLEELFPAP